MFDVLQTAVQGLRAAEARAAVAASNIANVRVEIQELDPNAPASPEAVEPLTPPQNQFLSGGSDSQGLANGRGTDLAVNLVELRLAQHAYEANAAVIRSAEETFEHLLDAVA